MDSPCKAQSSSEPDQDVTREATRELAAPSPARSKASEVGDKLLHSNKLFFTYLRSIVTSQAAGWTDMFIGFALFAWAGLTPWLSTAIGAMCGGILNCILNYRFTFRADDCDWRAVMTKYAMVWVGSMLLNTFGTQFLYYLMESISWFETIGFNPDGFYAVARVFTSLIVSWFWNFLLQRYFVYRTLPIDKYIVKAFTAVGNAFNSTKQ